MALLFGALMATVLLAVLAVDAIRNEVAHTRKSLATLAWEAAGAVAAAVVVNIILLRPFEIWARVLLFVVFASFIFLAAAYLSVESWRRAKVRQFDAPLHDLRQRLGERQEDYDRLTWEIRGLERNHPITPERTSDPDDEWRQLVSEWESAPGLARLRSLKTQEWREEVAKLDDIALEARRRALTGQLTGSDSERHDQVQAQLAIVELERAKRRGSVVAATEGGTADAGDPLEIAKRRRDELEREVRAIQSEMRALTRRRDEFLSTRVHLD